MDNSVSHVRCIYCGEWNELKDVTDLCVSCNKPLKPISEKEKENIEMRKHSWEIKVPIHENDSLFIRFFKHAFNAVQLVFIAIASFLIWLFFLSPG